MPRRYWWYIAAFILIVALAAIGMYVQAHAPAVDGGKGAQVKLPPGVACGDCRIQGGAQGGGAQLDYRYVNGVKTDTPVLPWPMEGRGLAELGISISAIWQEYAGR